MENYSKIQFKKDKKQINEIALLYKIYKFKLSLIAPDKLNKREKQRIKEYQSYINLIDSISTELSNESRKIITQCFFDKKSSDQYHCSRTTFYSKLKIALSEFFKYYR